VRAIAIGYHDVVDVESVSPDAVYTVAKRDFWEHLQGIKREQRYLRTIYRSSRWAAEVPVFLTFDDGTEGAYAFAADALEKHQWRGHFFITTDWIGRSRYMNRNQIRELHDRGHIIGSHSCSHPERMAYLNRNDLLREWKDSCAILSDILGTSVQVASVPGGYYGRNVALAAADAGIEVLFTSEPTTSAHVLQECLILGRYCIQRHTPVDVSGAIAAGHFWPRWQQSVSWSAKKLVKKVVGESYVSMRRRVLAARRPEQEFMPRSTRQ
jgi:peptidoglycan/xylan/chitin deacetylase (PgdA/CDA1 family)